MTTWSPPDAGDPFVGLNVIPETGDSTDELPAAATRFLEPVPPSALGHGGPGLSPHRHRRGDLRSPRGTASSRRPGHQRGERRSLAASHWLGTDDLGRDILSRLIWGARISLRAAFEIVGLAAILAIPLGLIAGFFRGAVDA